MAGRPCPRVRAWPVSCDGHGAWRLTMAAAPLARSRVCQASRAPWRFVNLSAGLPASNQGDETRNMRPVVGKILFDARGRNTRKAATASFHASERLRHHERILGACLHSALPFVKAASWSGQLACLRGRGESYP